MSLDPTWVPMKWPCGPLEMARKSRGGDYKLKETLEGWLHPSSLQVLRGSPINCLIVDWASGSPKDSAQQRALTPLFHAGRQLGISFVGKVAKKGNPAAAAAAGRAAGLSAVIVEGSELPSLDLPVILQFPRGQPQWHLATAIFSATGNVWPGVQLETMHGNTALAGPTGVPWVNSNGWFSLLARQMAPAKLLWLDVDPPNSPNIAHPADFCLTIADSWVYGSRWIISLDDKTRGGILAREARAMNVWSRMCDTISFFESHRSWEDYQPMGVLAVISDFRGKNSFMSGEVLNLLNRRQVQFLIINLPRASIRTKGLKAILWVDQEPPTPQQHARLLAFVRAGGLLIAATYWGPPGVAPHKNDWLFGYRIYNVLKGKIVVPEKGFQDPYEVARDVHLLVGRRNDLVRLYNPATTSCYSSISPDHREQLIQVMNYGVKPADFVTLWVKWRAESAKLWAPGNQNSAPLGGNPASQGTDFDLPEFSVNCAVEFERQP